jgi:hypothetical protein
MSREVPSPALRGGIYADLDEAIRQGLIESWRHHRDRYSTLRIDLRDPADRRPDTEPQPPAEDIIAAAEALKDEGDAQELAEADDRGEDVVGALGPAEGLGIGVSGVDVGGDRRLKLGGGAVGAAPDLAVGEQAEEALDLVQPGGGGRRVVQRASLGSRRRMVRSRWRSTASGCSCRPGSMPLISAG